MKDTHSDARFLADAALDWAATMAVLAVVGVAASVWSTPSHCAVVRDQWRKRHAKCA